MAAIENTVTTADTVAALDQEFVENYNSELSRLTEMLGIFRPEIVAAGTTMCQYKVTGSLTETERTEGDEVPLSKYTLSKEPIGEHTIKAYRKMTTAESIIKGGFENAVSRKGFAAW